ncbi:MAG: DUF1631 domain-containing protein [Moraxellaceae bacterium]|nr:DUF1631 domain-containing protein [Moraxellaceae bacterium]
MVDSLNPGVADPARARIQVPAVLETVRTRSLQKLGDLVKGMFGRLDTTIFDWAMKMPEAEQQRYHEILPKVRSRRADIEGRFTSSMISAFSSVLKTNQDQKVTQGFEAIDFSTLSLVDEDDMDVTVALDAIVARARLDYAAPLGLLRKRFMHLLPKVEMTERSLPLDPGPIADAFRDGLKLLADADVHQKLILLKVFQVQIMGELSDVIDEANQLLIDAGVLPELKLGSASKSPKPSADKPRPDAAKPEKKAVDTEEVFSHLQHMLSMGLAAAPGQMIPGAQYHGGQYVGGGGIGILPADAVGGSVAAVPLAPLNISPTAVVQTVATPELVALLSRIQELQPNSPLAQDSSSPSVGQVRGSIREGLRSDEVAVEAVKQADEDVINLVSMLFDFILDDDDLPTAMKALIGRLQIPLLKVAILDKSFFNAETHPARRLLNALAKAGIGWNSRDPGGDAVYAKIEEVVFRILNEFIDDLSLFAELLEEFTAFYEQQQKREETVDKRTRETEEGKARAELARAMVQQTLNRRLTGRQLPLVVVKLLQDAWRNVLYIHCLKEGTESEPWKQAVKVVDAVIWSVQPQPGADWQTRLKDVAPKLSNSLKKGLAAVNYDSLTTETLLRELMQVHMSMLKGQETPTVSVLDASAAVASKPGQVDAKEVSTADAAKVESVVLPKEELIQPVPSGLPSDDPNVLIVSRLNVGSWIEFIEEEKQDRHKLVARIRSVDKLIFANRRGIKVSEMSGDKLALDMSLGRARLVEEGQFIDRALESVIGNLRDLSEKTKTA